MPAAELPEFKTDLHVKKSQGNQISGVVRQMLQDRSGNLWFATQDGISRYDGNSLTYFDIRDEHDRTITGKSVAEDKQGNLWFGTTGGLTKYDGEFFTTFSAWDGLCHADVWSTIVDSSGLLWIGTLGGVCTFDGTKFVHFPIPAATERDLGRGVWSPAIVWDILEGDEGTMWFAAAAGVYKHDGETLQRVPVMESQKPHVTSIAEDRSGHLWFSTHDRGLIRFDGETFTNLTEQMNLTGSEVGRVCEDSLGNIWFAAEGAGVFRYDGSSVVRFSEKEGLPSNAMFFVYEDNDRRLWCGGWMGAYRLDGDSFVNVTRDGPW